MLWASGECPALILSLKHPARTRDATRPEWQKKSCLLSVIKFITATKAFKNFSFAERGTSLGVACVTASIQFHIIFFLVEAIVLDISAELISATRERNDSGLYSTHTVLRLLRTNQTDQYICKPMKSFKQE